MQGNKTNHSPNKTSFKSGHKRSAESIEKQRQTMMNQYADGTRKPPKFVWTPSRIKKMVENNIKTKLKRWPIGSKRLHYSRRGDAEVKYYVVKVSPHKRWQFEHRLVMEKHLGRKLSKFEIVHHIDQNTLNNSINNLQILTPTEHQKLHHTSTE